MSKFNKENEIRDIECRRESSSESLLRDDQIRVIQDRVVYHENYLGKLCTLISEYTLKSAAMRDKNDEIAKCIAKFAAEEKYDTMAKLALIMVSELMANVGDHRNAEVQRLEAKVLPTLLSYGSICRNFKADIHNTILAQDRAMSRIKRVQRIRDKINSDPKGQAIVGMAENEMEKAIVMSSRMSSLAQNQMVKFEQKRMQDVKDSLLAFFKIEIALHAKALEFYTLAYRHIDNIDEECDLIALKTGMGIEEHVPRKSNNHNHDSRSQNKPSEGEIQIMGSWQTDYTRNYVDEIRNYNTSPLRQTVKRNLKNFESNFSDHQPQAKAPAAGDSSSESEMEKGRKRKDKQTKRKIVSFKESDIDINSASEESTEVSLPIKKSVHTKKHD